MSQPPKRTILALLGFGIICLNAMPALADPEPVMDKAWWNNQSASVRDSVVSGLIEGFNGGFVAGYYVTNKNTEEINKYADYRNFSHSLHFYEDAITDFYSTYPTASKTTVGTILICNADKAVASCDTLGKPDK